MTELPSTDEGEQADPTAIQTTKRKSAKKAILKIPRPSVTAYGTEYVRMDVRPLTRLQRKNLGDALGYCEETQAKLENGTDVKRPSHLIKWILENLQFID